METAWDTGLKTICVGLVSALFHPCFGQVLYNRGKQKWPHGSGHPQKQLVSVLFRPFFRQFSLNEGREDKCGNGLGRQ